MWCYLKKKDFMNFEKDDFLHYIFSLNKLYKGKCHTLQSGFDMNKIGLKTGTSFGLYPMKYHIFVHDPAFFLQNYRPKTFPGFSLKTDFTNYGAALYISVIEHLDLNTKFNH